MRLLQPLQGEYTLSFVTSDPAGEIRTWFLLLVLRILILLCKVIVRYWLYSLATSTTLAPLEGSRLLSMMVD